MHLTMSDNIIRVGDMCMIIKNIGPKHNDIFVGKIITIDSIKDNSTILLFYGLPSASKYHNEKYNIYCSREELLKINPPEENTETKKKEELCV